MITMTSLAAQNQFGTLIDTAQRQPVSVTRHGRPVAVVLSYEDYQASQQTIAPHVAKWISESAPLRGAAASAAMQEHLSSMSGNAAADGLSEADVLRLLDDE